MRPLVSIIVPVYNVEKYLDRCLTSIVNQTYNNLEIIIIDDGSTDSSSTKCDEWANKDSRVKVIHQENQGIACTRNTGIKNISGKYFIAIDSDDHIYLNAIENHANKYHRLFLEIDIKYIENNEKNNIHCSDCQ